MGADEGEEEVDCDEVEEGGGEEGHEDCLLRKEVSGFGFVHSAVAYSGLDAYF